MFSRSRNLLLTFLQSYHVWVTSKIQINWRFSRGSRGSHRYWWFCLMDFHHFFSIYVFEVKESISDIPFELPCLDDLENSGQLPVQEDLRGTDDFVLWIFTISSVFMFSRSRDPFLTFLLSYHVWVTSKIQVNFRFTRFSEVLMILSHGFSPFLQYLCFRGQGIYFWHSFWATMFRWSCKSRLTSGSGGSQRYWWFCLMDFHNFFCIYVFKVKESISDILSELPCSGDLKNPGQLPVQEVLMILSYKFWKFLHYLCFRGQEIHCCYSYWATLFGWPRKSRATSGSRATQSYWWSCLMNFHNIFTIYVFMVMDSFADISTELPCMGDLENPEQLPVLGVFKVNYTT